MAKSDALFQLISALNQNEKRHFKLFTKHNSAAGNKNYLKLFDLMNAMKRYDEDELLRSLGNPSFAKNLSAGKNYLYGLIQKSLRQFYSGTTNKTAQILLSELWIDIHILLDKGLFKQALKVINRAKKICKRYHFNLDLLKINWLERDLKNNFARKNTIKVMQGLQKECTDLNYIVKLDLESFARYETVFTHIKNKDETKKVKAAVEEGVQYFERINEDHQELPIWTAIHYHNLQAQQEEYLRNHPGCAHHLSSIIDLFQEDEKLKNEYQDRYLNTLNNYFNSCLLAGQLENLPPLQEKLKHIKARNIRNEAKIAQHTFYYQMLYHLTKKQYKMVIELAPKIKACLLKFDHFLSINRKLTFIYNVAVAFFLEGLNQYKNKSNYQTLLREALDWLNEIENEPKFETRKDVKRFTKTLSAIIYFDLQEYQLVESKINIGIRYLKKENNFNSGEGLIFKTLQKVLSAKDKSEREQLYKKLDEDLKEFPGMEELRKWVGTKYAL